MPLTCNYYVTLRCNQRCVFCNIPHTNNGTPDREPTLAQLEANLRDLKRLGVRLIDITGGEPLLFKHLIDMLAIAKRYRLMTTVTTNGMLYPKYAKALAGKVNALLFSIDSPEADEHDRIRATKSFGLALQALRVARELKQPLYVSHVVTNESFAKVDEMIRFAKEQGAILYLNPCFSFFGNEGISIENAQGLLSYFGRPGIIVDRAQLKHIIAGGNDPEKPVCRAVTSTVVISPEDQLWLPCYHFKQDALPIDGRLYELYMNNPSVQRAKDREGRYDFCKGCTVYCYMRSSLMWQYPLDSMTLAAHYVRERARQRIARPFFQAPPIPAPVPAKAAPVRAGLPIYSETGE